MNGPVTTVAPSAVKASTDASTASAVRALHLGHRLEPEGGGVEAGEGDVAVAHDADDLGVGGDHEPTVGTPRFDRVSYFNILLK